MKLFRLICLTLFCLSSAQVAAIEVRTEHHARSFQSERPYYPAYANRLAASIKQHTTTVTDCHVRLENSAGSKVEDRLFITIEMDRQKLMEHLQSAHDIRVVTNREMDRYLVNFRKGIKMAASDVFKEIDQNAIDISITLTD